MPDASETTAAEKNAALQRQAVPAPRAAKPEELRLPEGGNPIGTRVGSEATVEDGTGPVLPHDGAALSEATRVKNKTLRDRDEKEFKKRGTGQNISFSYEGVMMVDPLDDNRPAYPISGGATIALSDKGITIRPLTEAEQKELFPAARTPDSARRANDLVAGSGTGGGGNPMHAGDARGVSSRTERQVGAGGATSQGGGAPGTAQPGGTQPPAGARK